MPTFIGFSTQHADDVRTIQVNTGVDGGAGSLTKPIRYGKKFRTVDEELVITDFINSLNISQGQCPGRPEFGTTLWSFIFEPNILDNRIKIENEIRRLANYDPRIILNSVSAYPQENGILLEVELAIQMFMDPQVLQILFDNGSQKASLV